MIKGKKYKIEWIGEAFSAIEATFIKEERGFYIFTTGIDKIVCRPSIIKTEIITEKEKKDE